MNQTYPAIIVAMIIAFSTSFGKTDGAPTNDSPKGVGKPNILFIIVDQLFADALSCRMGTQYLHTPAVDSIAKKGMFFTRAYAANPLCVPSRCSIMTGRYPHETGTENNATFRTGLKLDPSEFKNMGEYFREAGYQTVYFGKRHLCFDVDKSFESPGQPPPFGHDIKTTADAIAFLSKKHERPYLAVISFINPHNVCELFRHQELPDGPIGNPPPPEQCPPVPPNIAPQENGPDSLISPKWKVEVNDYAPSATPDDWRRLRWGYYRLIEKVDAQIGEVLDALQKSGQAANTLLVFTSDHGEAAGAHGWHQKVVFYDESARVPLIVSLKCETKTGINDKLVNTGLDILPTLLDYAGIPQPPKLTGRSLRTLAAGHPVNEWRDHIVAEDDFSNSSPMEVWSSHFKRYITINPERTELLNQKAAAWGNLEGRMLRSEHYKYCIYNYGERRESLVDMDKDPEETKNLAVDPKYHAILLQHRALLAKFGAESKDPLVRLLLADDVKPIPFPSPPPDLLKTEKEDRAAKDNGG